MVELTAQEQAEIAHRFEDFDFETATVYEAGDPETPARIVMARAIAARDYHRSEADKAMREAVDTCRAQGMSWHKIGLQLGVTGDAVRQRYAHT